MTEPERCGRGRFCDRVADSCNPTCRPRGDEGAPCNHSAWACADRDDEALVWCDDESLFIDELGACRGVHEQAPAGVDERCGLVETPGGPGLVTCEAPFECEIDFSDPDREYRCAARPTIGQSWGGDPSPVGWSRARMRSWSPRSTQLAWDRPSLAALQLTRTMTSEAMAAPSMCNPVCARTTPRSL